MSSLYATCATTTIDLSRRIWTPPPWKWSALTTYFEICYSPLPPLQFIQCKFMKYIIRGVSSFRNTLSPPPKASPPGPYILNHVSKHAVHPDHSLQNMSFGGLFILKVSPLKRVPPRLYFFELCF